MLVFLFFFTFPFLYTYIALYRFMWIVTKGEKNTFSNHSLNSASKSEEPFCFLGGTFPNDPELARAPYEKELFIADDWGHRE
uniref:Putative secreted protein n=1 Tax=Ixodes scapularis TaxID=6945 RepID=A0A4D5RW38_IXOSC